jgi:hypothetical protein
LLVLIGITFEATAERFGKIALIAWFIGLALVVTGTIALWAAAVSLGDVRNIRRYRVDSAGPFEEGQTVALAGRLCVEGEPLTAPFSGTRCAAYRYRITGQTRRTTSSGTGTRGQLCLLGAALASATLETGARSLPLLAVPDVDTDYRDIAQGGEWGDRALSLVQALSESGPKIGETEANGLWSEAGRQAEPPYTAVHFVSTGTGGAPSMSVTEDAVPVDQTVTVLGTWDGASGGLAGRRRGGMKVFKGDIDERLAALADDTRKGLLFGLPAGAVGVAVMSLAQWWPA